MGLLKRKPRISPEVAEACGVVQALLRDYYPYAYGARKDEDTPEAKLKAEAYHLLRATMQSGMDEISSKMNGQRTKVFSAKQLGAIDLLIESDGGGALEARQRILLGDYS